jgi:hypothetical protein
MLRRLALLIVPILVLAACSSPPQPDQADSTRSSGEAVAGQESDLAASAEAAEEEAGRGGAAEILHEQMETEERLEAYEQAVEDGTFGGSRSVFGSPVDGWLGARLLNPNTDDWEPAIAADRNAPYVYLLTTRYGEPKTCSSHCPTPFIPLAISKDGGRTFAPEQPLCVCRGSGAQYDPTIEVVKKTGDVYSAFLNADRAGGFSTVFIRSTDHGKTWTDPVHVYGHVAWTDKPEITMSDDGKDVYVSWNGPQGGDLYVGVSHDRGKTWTQKKLTSSKRYYFAYDAKTLPDGTIIFSESSIRYQGSRIAEGSRVWHHAIISRNNGKNWKNVVIDKVEVGEPCIADGCGPDFYTGQTSVSVNSNGNLVFAYEGASRELGPQTVYVRRSDDEGRTWGPRSALSVKGENATQPRLVGLGASDVRLWYMQTERNDNPDAWNVWYRRSTDGGATWSKPVRLNDGSPRIAGYINKDGSFEEIYGDYGEIDINFRGETVATWGEGFSWIGPGGTWYNVGGS